MMSVDIGPRDVEVQLMPDTNQPDWRLYILSDDHAIFVDATGQYVAEIETLDDIEDTADDEDRLDAVQHRWRLDAVQHRWRLDRRVMVADPHAEDERVVYVLGPSREWYDNTLRNVAESIGSSIRDLRDDLTDADPGVRAGAYLGIAGYHGRDNFDSYPTRMTGAEAEARREAWAEVPRATELDVSAHARREAIVAKLRAEGIDPQSMEESAIWKAYD